MTVIASRLKCMGRGRLYVTVRRGRVLWQEEYTGPQPYAGEDSEHWTPHDHGWKALRGDGRVMSPEWFRFLLGHGYVHVRFRPFIFKWAYYNGRVDVHFRWN